MFELSVACKYLIPRRRQLSVSIISLISILVISLVVWLIVVFLSVKSGIEEGWVQKLVALTAPVRIIPSPNYYKSYYYQIDTISESSDYTPKSIHEKLLALQTDPYNPEMDEEVPVEWEKPDYDTHGQLKDPVKLAYQAIQNVKKKYPDLKVSDYEAAFARLHLHLIRENPVQNIETESFIDVPAYFGSLDKENSKIPRSILPPTPEDRLNAAKNHLNESAFYDGKNLLPIEKRSGEGILLPKSFKEAGVLLGDKGSISFYTTTTTSRQEQRTAVFVAGFYDPGFIPIGAKFIIANKEPISMLRSAMPADENPLSNGFNIHFEDIKEADKIKQLLDEQFAGLGIMPYWQIQTYKQYEFTKDLIQQLQSENNLFTLLAAIIIIVACSNIVSMLIILVSDKKKEIGILRSMGASSFSIATIFGLCGICMGTAGSVLGVLFAILTLHHLEYLISFISHVQGFEMFNAAFYGETLPSQLSYEALIFVLISTVITSLLAGLVPAIKACLLKPSAILRAE